MPYKRKYRKYRRSKSRRGRLFRRTTVTRTRTLVNRILNKKTETKYFDIGAQGQDSYHNLGWGTVSIPPTTYSSIPAFFNPWINIQKGTDRFGRIGDKINPRGMSLRLYLENFSDRPNMQWRVVVAVLPKVFSGSIVTQSFSNTFQISNSGICNNTLLLPADHDAGVKFLYDRIHTPNASFIAARASGGIVNKSPTKTIKIWIKRKRANPIIYDTTNATLVNKPLAVFCIPYEQNATSQLDKVGLVSGFMRMYYKDV